MDSRDEIRQWVENQEEWPTADSYDISTLTTRPQLQRRESLLRPLVPEWFWHGEKGASILSIGTGKGYFERRYWKSFDNIYVIDPSQNTQTLLQLYPIHNANFLSPSLFSVSWGEMGNTLPKYGWLGSCIHYIFQEFHGWSFMQHLAMLVSDTLVIDAGVFDAQSASGSIIIDQWKEMIDQEEPYDHQLEEFFSLESFLDAIEGLWVIESNTPTPWIEGRRNMVLKRSLPPPIQYSNLGPMRSLEKHGGLLPDVFKTDEGYFKKDPTMWRLLTSDTYSKCLGRGDMVQHTVYDGNEYVGFLVKDYGDIVPDPLNYEVSEHLFMSLLEWLIPFGLVPWDVARENIRIYEDEAILIDCDFGGVRNLNPTHSLWMMANIYKQYRRIPDYIVRPGRMQSVMNRWKLHRDGRANARGRAGSHGVADR